MKTILSSCIFLIIFSFPAFIQAQSAEASQPMSETEVPGQTNRPQAGQLGFNLSMSLLSNSEQNELMYRNMSAEQSLYTNGLGMSFRWYLTDQLAARAGLNFFNFKTNEDVLVPNNDNIAGIRSWQSRLGLMLATKGTDKLEPYFFLDAIYGKSQLRVKPHRGDMERTDLISTIGAVPGIGFNYYFAKNIAVGAELGAGIMRQNPVQETESWVSFRSGANGNIGVSVFF